MEDLQRLQARLLEAARQGSIGSLREILKEDSSILNRGVVNRFNETPLHIAAMSGHLDFVNEIIRLKPELVNELSLEGSSPLHLASAEGHVDVVTALLLANEQACFTTPDKKGLTPLHLAAVKGRVEVVKLLLTTKPEAARLNVYGGGNILHLCVKDYQLETLKILVEGVGESTETEFINSKNDDGNTVLHLAVADKQVETVKLLMSVSSLKVDALNNKAMTAMDVLIQNRSNARDSEIEKSLKNCEVFPTSETNKPAVSRLKMRRLETIMVGLRSTKSAWMGVAILVAIKAFQIGVSPQEDDHLASSDHPAFTIPAHRNLKGFNSSTYIPNVKSYIVSLCLIVLLLISLLVPLVWRFLMWVSITVALCYLFVIIVLTPNSHQEYQSVFFEVVHTVIVWVILMALLTVVKIISMIVNLPMFVWRRLVARVR